MSTKDFLSERVIITACTERIHTDVAPETNAPPPPPPTTAGTTPHLRSADSGVGWDETFVHTEKAARSQNCATAITVCIIII